MNEQPLTLEERLTLIEAQLIEAKNKKKKRYHKGVAIGFNCSREDHEKLMELIKESGQTKSEFMRGALNYALIVALHGEAPLKPKDANLDW